MWAIRLILMLVVICHFKVAYADPAINLYVNSNYNPVPDQGELPKNNTVSVSSGKNRELLTPEILVVGLCIGQYACDKASEAYYLQHPELQKAVKNAEEVARDAAGPFVSNYLVPVIMPMALLSTGQTGTIKIDKHWSVTGSTSNQNLLFTFSY